MSIPISIFSLTLASCKLFYSQRLGSLSEPDPSFKMILIISPFIICQISWILFSLIANSTYYCFEVTFITILFTLLTHFCLLKMVYLRKKETKKIIATMYNNQQENGTKEISSLFCVSTFTAWVSPYSVWANNLLISSNFLFFSSAITNLIILASSISLLMYDAQVSIPQVF